MTPVAALTADQTSVIQYPAPSLDSPKLTPAPDADDLFWDCITARPDFAIIGAPKSGTSWLCNCLNQMPSVTIPGEQNFFTIHRDKGVAYYNGLFVGADDTLFGDYSNTYMLDANLPDVFAKRFAGVKVVMIGREPVGRAYSHYLMDVSRGALDPETTSFEKVLRTPVTYSYFDFGLYAKHLKRFLEVMPTEDVLFLTFEDVTERTAESVKRIMSRFGRGTIPHFETTPDRNSWSEIRLSNTPAGRMLEGAPRLRRLARAVLPDRIHGWLRRGYRTGLRAVGDRLYEMPELSPETARWLGQQYRSSIDELEDIAQRDLSAWKRA